MFGSKKQNAKVNDWCKTLDEYSDNKLHGHIGKLIEDKLDALEKKLTKQMLCKHENYSVKGKSFSPVIGALPIHFSYWKVCDDCGIDLGPSNAYEKEQREYEIAKQNVEQFEESQLKEPEELPSEDKAQQAEKVLSEALYEVEMTCSMCREGAFKLAEAIREAVKTLKQIQD